MSDKPLGAQSATAVDTAGNVRRDQLSHAAPTPGPWAVSPRLEGHVFAGDELIAGCMGHSRNFDDAGLRDRQIANARLIAAAPELLSVVRAYVAACKEQDIKLGSITGDALAAIAKAEGRQP
jgi:hypothetical protein